MHINTNRERIRKSEKEFMKITFQGTFNLNSVAQGSKT